MLHGENKMKKQNKKFKIKNEQLSCDFKEREQGGKRIK